MKYLSIFFLFSLTISSSAQTHEKKLLNEIEITQLKQAPYDTWYTSNFDSYHPNTNVVDALKKQKLSNYSIKIYFGSWCGDSKRELPRMMRLLKEINFPDKNIALIGVDDSTEVYKQSPKRLEAGLNIYRVPTFIIYDGKNEVSRIVEYPVETLERDLLKIVSRQAYQPNYAAYQQINQWKKEGLLTDENISARGLAMKIKGNVSSESELNACGYVMMASGEMKEAITVFRINANLYPQSANCYDSLGEAYAKSGVTEKAIQAYEIALLLDPTNTGIQERLKKLKGGS
jgi:tetratricopeptide (TPR) repeat protein